MKGNKLLSYGLLAPAFIVSIFLFLYPFFLVLSFSLKPGATLSTAMNKEIALSLKSYLTAFSARETWQSVGRSFLYTFGSLFPSYFLGLITAIVLNRGFRGKKLCRTLIILPWSIPGVVASIMFVWILDATYGVFNYILHSLHLIDEYPAWLFNPRLVMISVILPTIWKGYPLFTLTILAALQSIPSTLYEAARVDGCGFFRQFFYITWYGIKRASILAMILNGLWSFRVFDIIYAMTQGGPNKASTTIALNIYNEAFRFFDISYASAIGMISFLICAVIVLALYPYMKKDAEQ